MNPTHQDMEKGANTVNEVQILEKEYDLKKMLHSYSRHYLKYTGKT